MNRPALDEAVLRQIDREIPYHILFVLEYQGKYQAWIAYKEPAAGDIFKVGDYYHTAWMTADALLLRLDGLDMDAVYENYVRQIAGDRLPHSPGESLKDSIERETKRRALEKQISALEGKIRREKQLNVQMQMNAELKKLRKDLEEL